MMKWSSRPVTCSTCVKSTVGEASSNHPKLILNTLMSLFRRSEIHSQTSEYVAFSLINPALPRRLMSCENNTAYYIMYTQLDIIFSSRTWSGLTTSLDELSLRHTSVIKKKTASSSWFFAALQLYSKFMHYTTGTMPEAARETSMDRLERKRLGQV